MTTAAPARLAPASSISLGQPGQRLHLADLLPGLAQDGLISAEDAQRMGQYARLSNADVHPLVNLAQRNLIIPGEHGRSLDIDTLVQWLARQVNLPYVHIDPLKVELGKISEVMSSQYATRWRILPIEVRAGEVVVATAEPFVTEWVAELTGLMRRDVRVVIANPQDISRYIVEFFSLAKSVRDAHKLSAANPAQNLEQLVEMGRSGKNVDANDQQIVTIVDWLWQYAFDQRASDIHLEPRRETGVIRFRIDGMLHNVYRLPPSVLAAMTSRIKLLGRMDVVEKRRPLDGRIKTRTAEGKEIELRLSTLPTAFGEKMVMRIFDPEVLVRSFHELGFADDELKVWRDMTARPNGIILVTGPTGSGKTTTLYTTLKQLATEEVNVCTVEDPIEMVEPSFNQMQVQASIDLDFAQGVRALMRQDPDIIMVGEIRDLETANMAIQAALTGHLVLSTLHTNDAPSAITRLLDIGVPAYLLNATVIGVMAQRLVRTLCSSCKAPLDLLDQSSHETHAHTTQWQQLIRPFKAALPKRVYRPVGCLECRMTGYKGRTGLYELLVLSDELRELIDSTPDLRKIRAKAMQDGLKPLRLSGAQKIAQGQTTFEEVLKAAPTMGDY
jgi:general secretion pathway protein E